MNKKIIIVQYPNIVKLLKIKLQGNKKEISKSKIIKIIPTKKNLTSNFCLESPNGSNPHSYTEIFSVSPFFTANT